MTAPRTCGPCDACCWALAITTEPIIGQKEMWVPCRFLAVAPEHGCGIYHSRPPMCQRWRCAWLAGHLADDMRPHESGVLAWGEYDEERGGAFRVVLGLRDTPEVDERAFAVALDAEAHGARVVLHLRRDYWSRADYLTNLCEWLVWHHDTRYLGASEGGTP